MTMMSILELMLALRLPANSVGADAGAASTVPTRVTAQQKCEKEADCAQTRCTARVSGETFNQTPVSQACLDQASLNLSTAFANAESGSACPGTAAAVAADMDAQYVASIKNGLPGL